MEKKSEIRIRITLIFISIQLANISLFYAAIHLMREQSFNKVYFVFVSQIIAFFYTWLAYRFALKSGKKPQNLRDNILKKEETKS